MKKAKAKATKWQQLRPKAGATYSPRSLFRGLTVPVRFEEGKSRIHPKVKA